MSDMVLEPDAGSEPEPNRGRGRGSVGVVDREQAVISDRRSDIGHLAALPYPTGAAPYGPAGEHPSDHGWRAYGTEAWFSWARVEHLRTPALAEL